MVLSAVDGECEVNQILEYGFDELRLARPLVSDARHDPTCRRVIDGTVALARALGLAVIAVGIDTDADRAACARPDATSGRAISSGRSNPQASSTNEPVGRAERLCSLGPFGAMLLTEGASWNVWAASTPCSSRSKTL